MAPRVFAADDSNGGNLTATTNSTTSTASTNQTLDTLQQLSRGVNDTQYAQLLNQLDTQLHDGNNIGAQQTLTQLKAYTDSSQGTKLPASLRDLVQSLSVDSNGLTLDSSLLSQLIGTPGSNGMPMGLNGMDPVRAANDLQSLSSLTQNIDPKTSLSLAQDSNQLQDSIHSGLFGGDQSSQSPQLPKPPSVQIGKLGAGGKGPFFPNVSATLPGGPGLSGGGGSPILPIIVVVIAGIAGLLFLNRKRLNLHGRRVTPNSFKAKLKLGKSELGLNLKSPRDLIIYYFRKAVAAMHKRGVPRLDYETHREFSVKCSPRPEAVPISDISVLFEKAMFSGREVTLPEADQAQQDALQVENSSVTTDKEHRQPSRSALARLFRAG